MYWPSAGKLAAGKVSDQLPPASDAVWKDSVPEANDARFLVEAVETRRIETCTA